MMILELLHTLVLPSRTVYIMHSVVDISTMVGLVSVPKRSALETSRRELSEDVSFGIGTLLGVEQSSLKNRPRGVIMDMLGDALDNVDRGCVYQR